VFTKIQLSNSKVAQGELSKEAAWRRKGPASGGRSGKVGGARRRETVNWIQFRGGLQVVAGRLTWECCKVRGVGGLSPHETTAAAVAVAVVVEVLVAVVLSSAAFPPCKICDSGLERTTLLLAQVVEEGGGGGVLIRFPPMGIGSLSEVSFPLNQSRLLDLALDAVRGAGANTSRESSFFWPSLNLSQREGRDVVTGGAEVWHHSNCENKVIKTRN